MGVGGLVVRGVALLVLMAQSSRAQTETGDEESGRGTWPPVERPIGDAWPPGELTPTELPDSAGTQPAPRPTPNAEVPGSPAESVREPAAPALAPPPLTAPPAPRVGRAPADASGPVPLDWRMPEDAAARHTPFINATTGGLSVGERFDSGIFLGAELGGFLAARFRVSLRVLFPFGVSEIDDQPLPNPEFGAMVSEKPALVYGAAAGVALYSGRGFVLSAAATFMRSDVADYGNMLGLALPFEWITRGAARVGFEFGVLQAFGGRVLGECGNIVSFGNRQAGLQCDLGEVRAFERQSAPGVWINFILGIPYDTPEPTLSREQAAKSD